MARSFAKTSLLAALLIATQAAIVGSMLCQHSHALAQELPGALRTIEFETSEATEADVAISPDGQTLVFTMLGRMFRLPLAGGTAEQLTFGPYYDADPVFSPDGKRVAFVSDRDESEGNIFVLELATGKIVQITKEAWTGRPAWTPDGDSIVYLSFLTPGVENVGVRGSISGRAAWVRRISLAGGEPQTLSASPRLFRSMFYLPDGRLAWAVIEQDGDSRRWKTQIEVVGANGKATVLRTLAGYVDRVIASSIGTGLYCRHYLTLPDFPFGSHDYLLFLPMPTGSERPILSLSGRWWNSPRFAVSPDNKSLYLGEGGRLWKVALPGGSREPVVFSARVKLEVHEPVTPPKPHLGRVQGPRTLPAIISPRLSPDGRTLVFGAAGYLWRQALEGGPAERLPGSSGIDQEPAFSPDGRQLAYVHIERGKDEIRIFNFENRQTHTLASGPTYWGSGPPSWSPDGRRLVFADFDGHAFRIAAVSLSDGKKETVTGASGEWWSLRPHFSADGESLYFSDNRRGNGMLYKLLLSGEARPKPVTALERHLSDGLVSPDGKWLAFRRNREIWVARLGKGAVTETDVCQLSPEGGRSFAFTPDSSAVIYSVGNRVWRHPLAGGERQEIPIRLDLKHLVPPPLLLRRVRVLDLKTGSFGPETSLFVEQGRIRWIGSERGRSLPPETVVVEAQGRFVIPGLVDLHVHGDSADQAAFLAYGITSVRDPGGSLARLRSWADRSKITSDPIPRRFFSGEQLIGARPLVGDWEMLLYNEDDARAYVRRAKEADVHFIKVHAPISWPLQRAVAEEARRQGLPVVGHGFSVEEITKSVTMGYWSLVHITRLGRFYDDVIQMLAAAGTRWDPNLALLGGNQLLLRDEPERLAEAKLRAFVSAANIRKAQSASRAWDLSDRDLRGQWQLQLAAIRAAHRRGVNLQIGTDSGGVGGSREDVFFGPALHWELEYFAQAGILPLEVLRIATQQAAEALGAQDDLGTIEPGKLADIVLLDANPLDDIRNTQKIWRVIKDGWLFDPAELASNVDKLRTSFGAPEHAHTADSQILFDSTRTGANEIHVMNADGSNVRQLTNVGRKDVDSRVPGWSPDRAQIVFQSNRDGNPELYVMDADGGNVRRLTHTVEEEGGPAWSPDGKRIAYERATRDASGNYASSHIWVMNADGSGVQPLTSGKSRDWYPAWSPDGQKLAFVSNRGGEVFDIWVMDADGSNLLRLTQNAGTNAGPAWSPDGKQIAFDSIRDGNWELYIMDADGSNIRRLTNTPDRSEARPAWSPDGKRIAFNAGREGAWDTYEICVIAIDSSNRQCLTNNDTFDAHPDWR